MSNDDWQTTALNVSLGPRVIIEGLAPFTGDHRRWVTVRYDPRIPESDHATMQEVKYWGTEGVTTVTSRWFGFCELETIRE